MHGLFPPERTSLLRGCIFRVMTRPGRGDQLKREVGLRSGHTLRNRRADGENCQQGRSAKKVPWHFL